MIHIKIWDFLLGKLVLKAMHKMIQTWVALQGVWGAVRWDTLLVLSFSCTVLNSHSMMFLQAENATVLYEVLFSGFQSCLQIHQGWHSISAPMIGRQSADFGFAAIAMRISATALASLVDYKSSGVGNALSRPGFVSILVLLIVYISFMHLEYIPWSTSSGCCYPRNNRYFWYMYLIITVPF